MFMLFPHSPTHSNSNCKRDAGLADEKLSWITIDAVVLRAQKSKTAGKMEELRGAVSPANLFSPAGNNGDFFTSMWAEATKCLGPFLGRFEVGTPRNDPKLPRRRAFSPRFRTVLAFSPRYFNAVCLPSCNTNFDTANTSASPRSWTYEMANDNPLATYWEMLKTSGALSATIQSQFTFTALPFDQCPYGASKCVPMPGVQFTEASLSLSGLVLGPEDADLI